MSLIPTPRIPTPRLPLQPPSPDRPRRRISSVHTATTGQEPPPKQVAQEREQAEFDGRKLADILELRPGMTVADIGAALER